MLKQMRLIHTKGFSTSERKQWKMTIFQNLIHAFQVVFGAMEEQELALSDASNIVRPTCPASCANPLANNQTKRFAEIIAADPEIGPEDSMPLDCLAAFKSLWRDEGVQTAIKRGNEYALHDNLT